MIIEEECKYESVVIKRWEDMDFNNEFDIIVGDLTVGNIHSEKLEKFIINVKKSLRDGGVFLDKNFLIPNEYKTIEPKKLIKEYYSKKSYYHSFSFLIFDLAIYCIDEDNMLDFKVSYDELLRLKEEGLITYEMFRGNCMG